MAMVVSFAIKSWIEGGVITFVILLNIVVGFFQEFSAEKTLNSIRTLGSPTARVLREGNVITVPTKELVPGDIVELTTGTSIPADLRVIEAVNLETDEALLTGESLPVAKNSQQTYDADVGAGDRLNVAYSSSSVTKGRGRGVVFAIVSPIEIHHTGFYFRVISNILSRECIPKLARLPQLFRQKAPSCDQSSVMRKAKPARIDISKPGD